MKFGIVGLGVVGRHIRNDLAHAGTVSNQYFIYDPAINFNNCLAINECETVFVCVPTPQAQDGSADLSAIHEVFSWLRVPCAIIRSTVPPGTTERLQKSPDMAVVFCPEFIGEGVNAPYVQMRQPPFLILGGQPWATHRAAQAFARLYNSECRIFTPDARTAETIKYAENSYLATRVTFFNEWRDICAKLGANWEQFVLGLGLDYRIGYVHSHVYDDERGFSGRCLPKDTAAILAQVGEGTAPLLAAVRRINEEHRKRNA